MRLDRTLEAGSPGSALAGAFTALALTALTLTALALTACGTTPTVPPTRTELVQEIETKGLEAEDVVIPFDLDDEMKRWVAQSVPEFGPEEEKLNFLLVGLLSDRRLGIEYEGGYTGTAREVFDSRKANCLSFTQLFVGMAREAGLEAYYLQVGDIEGFERDGDLIIVSGHVTAGYGDPLDRQVLEFNLGPEVDYRRAVPISDRTAIGLYYTNRAAELIRDDRLEEALQAADTALQLDPELAIAWVNRGVGLRRLGRWEEAEASYRRALAIRPNFVTAYQDLATVLQLQGRDEEAAELRATVDRLGSRNPYHQLRLGDASLAKGDSGQARIYYRRALRLMRDDAEPYAALGLTELIEGNPVEAQSWLQRAQAVDPKGPRVELLEQRLVHGEELSPEEFVELVNEPAAPLEDVELEATQEAGGADEVTGDPAGEPQTEQEPLPTPR